MSILLLTGPPASGKNTIANAVAKRLSRCAVIDGDRLLHMIVSPAEHTWDSEQAERFRILKVRNACALVKTFEAEGFDTIVVALLTNDSVNEYAEILKDYEVKITLLLPSEDEVNSRLLSRPDYLSRGETQEIYKQQSEFKGYDEVLDNTTMSSEQAADWVLQRWGSAQR